MLYVLGCEQMTCWIVSKDMGSLAGRRVVSKGVVTEQGRHQELLDAGGAYSALVRRQMQRSESSASLASSQDRPSGPHLVFVDSMSSPQAVDIEPAARL